MLTRWPVSREFDCERVNPNSLCERNVEITVVTFYLSHQKTKHKPFKNITFWYLTSDSCFIYKIMRHKFPHDNIIPPIQCHKQEVNLFFIFINHPLLESQYIWLVSFHMKHQSITVSLAITWLLSRSNPSIEISRYGGRLMQTANLSNSRDKNHSWIIIKQRNMF